MLVERWLPIHWLLVARFSADLKQLFDNNSFIRKEGGRHIGGAPALPNPPGGDRVNDTFDNPAVVLQRKVKSWYPDGHMQVMYIFLPRSCRRPTNFLPKFYRFLADVLSISCRRPAGVPSSSCRHAVELLVTSCRFLSDVLPTSWW